MKLWVTGGLALAAATVAAILLAGPPQARGPEPIAYGVDTCDECHMILTRPGFGGELRTADGAVKKFDDVTCLLRAMVKQHAEMPEAWVEDHGGGGFVPLLGATLVHTAADASPMGHGVLAFADEAGARDYAAEHGGTIVALESLVRDPGALARADAPVGKGSKSP